MGRKLRIGLVSICLFLAGVVVWLSLFGKEIDPSYQGKRLSTWIEEYEPAQGPTAPATEALLHFGSDATPMLSRMLQARDSNAKVRFLAWLAKVMQLRVKIQYQPAAFSREHALHACNLLDTNVIGVVPTLVAVVDGCPLESNDASVAIRALNVLAQMGPKGIPGLLHGLTNGDPSVRIVAARLLGTTPAPANSRAVVELEKCAKSNDSRLSAAASQALRLISETTSQKSNSRAEFLPHQDSSTRPALSLWDYAGGLRVISTTGLTPGFRAENVFGGNVGAAERGAVIFQDARPDGFVHAIEWELHAPVSIESFGVIAHHDAGSGNSLLVRSFRSFRLSAWNEESGKYEVIHSENVPVPYGAGFGSTMLFVFRNLQKPVTSRRFRAEFVQNDVGVPGFGPRLTQLCAFPGQLDPSTIKAAVHNPNPSYQFGVADAIEALSKNHE